MLVLVQNLLHLKNDARELFYLINSLACSLLLIISRSDLVNRCLLLILLNIAFLLHTLGHLELFLSLMVRVVGPQLLILDPFRVDLPFLCEVLLCLILVIKSFNFLSALIVRPVRVVLLQVHILLFEEVPDRMVRVVPSLVYHHLFRLLDQTIEVLPQL